MKNNLLTIFLTIICISAYSQSYNSLDELLEADYLPINRIVSVKDGENSTSFKIEKGQGDNITSFSITASKKAVLIGDISLVNLSFIGVKYGEGLSKAEMQSNWAILKSFVYNYSDTLNLTDDLHIWVEGDDALTVEKDLTIKGNKNTLYIHPRKKGFRGTRKVFRHTFGNINIDDLYLKGYSDRWLLETYEVTFKPSGDQDAVLLSGSQSSSFWSNLSTGDTIAFQVDDATPGNVFIVSAFDEPSKTISFTSNFGTADDYTVSGQSYIGIRFEENANSSDIQTYGKSWNVQDNEASALYEELIFISSLNTDTTAAVLQDNYKEFTFNNCEFEGMDYNLRLSGTWLNVYSNNTKEQANAISNSWTGGLVNKLSKVVKNQGVVYDCGTVCEASVNNNGVVSTNAIFGGGYYLHPAFVPNFNGVLFRDNNTTSYRNFSSSGNDITGEGWIGSFENCIWQSNNFEPLLITSKSWPTQIINCTFNAPYDGGQTTIQLGNSTSMIGCTVDAPIYLGLNSEPSNEVDDRYFLNFEDCVFYQNARIDLSQWPSATESKATFTFNNSTFFPSNNNADFTIKYSTGNLLINDCFIDRMNEDANGTIYNSSTNLNAFIQLDEGASDSNPFGTVSINNLRTLKDFSSNDMPIIKGYDENSSTATTADISGYVFNINVVGESGFTQENLSSVIPTNKGSLFVDNLKSDVVQKSDFTITGTTTLTSASSTFTSSDVGKTISIYGAGDLGAEHITTIASVTSATQVELTTAASINVTSADGFYATNNSPLLDAAIEANKDITISYGTYYFADEIAKNDVDNFSVDFQGSTIYFNTFFNSSWGEGYNDNLEPNIFDLQNCDNVSFENVTAEFLGQTFALNDTISYSSEFSTTTVSSTEVTVTSATNVFTASDVNKIIRLQSAGSQYYYFYISEFVSSSEVSIKDGGGFDNPNLGTLQTTLTNVNGKIFSEDGYTGILQGQAYDRRWNKRGNTGDFLNVNTSTNINLTNVKSIGLGQLFGITGSDNSGVNIVNCEVDGYGSVAISPCDYTTIKNCIIDNEEAQAITAIDQGQNLGTSHAIYTTQKQQNVIIDNNDLTYIRGVAIQWNTGSSGKSKGHFVTNNYMFEAQRAGTIQGSADWEITFENNLWENCGRWDVNSANSKIYINGDTFIGEPTEQTDYFGAWAVVNASYFELKNSTINGVFTGSTGTDVSALSFSLQSASQVRDINVNIDNNIFINNTNDLQFISEVFALTTGNEIKVTRNEFLGNIYIPKRSFGTYRQANLEEYILFEDNNLYGTTFIRMGASFLYNNFTKIGNSDLALDIDMLSDAGAVNERDLVLNHNTFDRINGTDSDIIELSAASDLRVVFDYNQGLNQSAQVQLNGGSFISRKGLHQTNTNSYFIKESGNTSWTLESPSLAHINFKHEDANQWKIGTEDGGLLDDKFIIAYSGNSSLSSGVRMTISSTGNVGIGTDRAVDASEKLEVQGNIKLNDNAGTVRADLIGNADNRGTVTITEAQTGSYTFNVSKSDGNYVIATSVEIVSGTPDANEIVHTISKTSTAITFTLVDALDVGEAVKINWILVQ